jgi:hypothetical protein
MRNGVSAHTRGLEQPYATRRSKDHEVSQRGDLVQLDTLDIRPLLGAIVKHSTAHDVISRWDVLGIHNRATATRTAHFLGVIEEGMSFGGEGYPGRWGLRVSGSL